MAVLALSNRAIHSAYHLSPHDLHSYDQILPITVRNGDALLPHEGQHILASFLKLLAGGVPAKIKKWAPETVSGARG